MDDSTFTSNTASMDRRSLLEQLAIIRSLMHKKCTANDDAGAATAAARNRNVVEDRAKEGVRLINDQMAALSTELLLTVMSDMMLLRLLDGLGLEEGRAVSSDASSSPQQLMDDDAAAKKKQRAAAKKKRYKRNKAAAKQQHKKTKLMSWLGSGIISVIMMVAFSFISTPIVTLSLFQPSDGSGEGNAPPALPPSASKSLRQKDLQRDDEASNSPDIIRSPLAAVVPPPIFAPADVSNRRVISDEMRASTCLDTPNWEDVVGYGCDIYESYYLCSSADEYAGDMGTASTNCCICGGGSHSLPPTTSPKPSSSPTKSANPTQSCLDTPNWKDANGAGCDWYEKSMKLYDVCSYDADDYAGDMGPSTTNCCICGGGSHSLPPTNSPTISSSPTKSATPSSSSEPSSSPTKSANPTQFCLDTPNWEDVFGWGCDSYEKFQSMCPYADKNEGDMGTALKHCCICGGGSATCEDFKSKCQEYIHILDVGFNESGLVAPLCKEAESCSCEEGADHDVKIVTNVVTDDQETAGLYNKCKCGFWSRLCEDKGKGKGEACDYAAEYCCGDYLYHDNRQRFVFLNSPTCYCDFFNYARNEFGHTLKPNAMAMNISKEFENPCGQRWGSSRDFEVSSLEAIYNETNGQNWTNSAGWMNEPDHCQWHGITCDGDGFVTSIDLRDNNLSGQFPVYSFLFKGQTIPLSYWLYSKGGLANLYHLKTLDLSDNMLTGTIDYRPLYNLHLLSHFDVSGNQLSGDVDALVTPSLTYADFHNNKFTSMRRFEKYKQSYQKLRYCDMSNNTIQNDATDLLENIPPNIERFLASNNQMHGNLPASLNSLSKISQFNMSSNALSGTLPGFADSILSLQQLDLSNQTNGFTGSIPEDLWRFQSLKVLNLASNKIAGHIPPDIGKMAALEEFDLSNNRLVNAIPSELGQLAGSLKHLRLSNNMFTGSIPSEIGQLRGATVLLKLKENNFYNSFKAAPLVLCTMRSVKEFDLANDTQLCPGERNALSDFYYSTKGAEWTNDTNWLDEYESYCDWHGVTCNEDKTHVTKLELRNNGLSGRLRETIGNLTLMEVLDLSDNDIKGSIPTEIGQLFELTYLRLSYNAFTGTAPRVLGKLTKLQLLQLQSNRITKIPDNIRLDDAAYRNSTFVTDCGVPSAFENTPECKDCTMCCNANDDCYPTEKTNIADFGYGNVAAVFFACFIVICFAVALSLYLLGKRKNRGNTLTVSAERRLEEDDTYALRRIGKDSVYSYFVTEKPVGWLAAFATLGIQVAILAFFVMASEANLQKDTIDIQFTWKCPRDSDVCKDKADLTEAGWMIFSMLMIAFLAKDIINGCKLIYHSSKVSHTLGSRIRYFIGGTGLCSITLFALYVSTVYNKAIATSNTDIIVNSVIVLFIMEIDEYIFAALEASNKKWTAHVAESEDSSLVTEVSEMKVEFELQRAQIESQQEQIDNQQEEITGKQEQIDNQQKQINGQKEELKMLREMVEKIQESQAAAAAALTTSDSESACVECEGSTNVQVQQMEQADQIAMPCEAEENTQESKAAAAASDLESEV